MAIPAISLLDYNLGLPDHFFHLPVSSSTVWMLVIFLTFVLFICYLEIFLLALSFQLWCNLRFTSGEGVSGPICDLLGIYDCTMFYARLRYLAHSYQLLRKDLRLYERVLPDTRRLARRYLGLQDGQSRAMQQHWLDLMSVALQSSLFQYIILYSSLIRLVFDYHAFVYYSTMTSLDL